MKSVGRAQSTLSVSGVDYYLNLPSTSPPSPAISTVTLTPGRIRNIDQDMEALRASRQDNPFIQVRMQITPFIEEIMDNYIKWLFTLHVYCDTSHFSPIKHL